MTMPIRSRAENGAADFCDVGRVPRPIREPHSNIDAGTLARSYYVRDTGRALPIIRSPPHRKSTPVGELGSKRMLSLPGGVECDPVAAAARAVPVPWFEMASLASNIGTEAL